jgi:hypothetical protein
MTATTATRFGYPTWLAIVAAVVGAFATLMGLAAAIVHIVDSSDDSGYFGVLLLTVGVGLLLALWLLRRAPLASVLLLALGGLAFGLVTFWMVVTVVLGVVIAVGAVLSAPRVLGARPSA